MPRESKLKIFLKNKKIKRWYDNVARGAKTTADVYLRRVIAVCEQLEATPESLAEKDEEELYIILLDFVSSEEQRGMAGSYIETSVKATKSWLAHNRKFVKGKIKIKDSRKAPTLENERVPTLEELKKIFLASTPRDRVSCALLAHSGFRPETLGNYEGTDGLRISDFPEMEISGMEVTFKKMPTMVNVRSELSKAGHIYFSFLSEEGCDYLKQYLEERLRDGEKITEETDILTPKWHSKQFIRTINIGDGIRKSIRGAGFTWRPYVLRSFFDTQLLVAESKGKIVRDYRQFFMGHVGDIEARYTTNKGKLPFDLVEDMRESYSRCMVHLQTIFTQDEEREKILFKKNMFRVLGVSEDEMTDLGIDSMDNDDIMDYLRKKLMNSLVENGNRQQVIDISELRDYMSHGWEYVNTLPDQSLIIQLPKM